MVECCDLAGNRYAKVGKANSPLSRLPPLQVGCPFEFTRVRWVFVESPAAALRAEKRVHIALKRYAVRGEWFVAMVGDDAAALALDCFPEVVAAVAKGPVKVQTMDVAKYDKARKMYAAVFGKSRAEV